ncbi:MAG: hypothetical protein KGI67_01050 [Pseudomonadota bacterium]|nr:hypothetical protein [Pseudomonadota bacterium]
MKLRNAVLLTVLATALSDGAWAGVYACSDALGNTTLADTPVSGMPCDKLGDDDPGAAPGAPAAQPAPEVAAAVLTPKPQPKPAPAALPPAADYAVMMRTDSDLEGNPLPGGPLQARGRRYKMLDRASYMAQNGIQ